MRGRWRLIFPYALFAAIIALVVLDNRGHGDAGPVAAAPATATFTDPICGMTVDPATSIGHADARGTVYFCGTGCRDQYVAGADTSPVPAPGALRDPVCNMDVNAAWGFTYTHADHRYDFCSTRCRDAFAAHPDTYLQARCIVCTAPLAGSTPWTATYQGRTYEACSEAHRAEFQADPASYFLHQMWGIPPGLYFVSIAAVLIVSFVGFEWRGRRLEQRAATTVAAAPTNGHVRAAAPVLALAHAGVGDSSGSIDWLPDPPLDPPALPRRESAPPAAETPPRFDLMAVPWVARVLRWPPTRFLAQGAVAALFLLIVAAGLFGNQNPALNIAPILTWTVWWGGLVLLIMFAGKAWCYVCPWDALAGWAERGRFWGAGEGMSLGLTWPRALRNIWPATILFIGLTWIELGWGVTTRPRVTAYLALAMFALAFVSAFVFDRKAFCRYGCLVGRVSGLYALFSGLELRARDRGVCRGCRTKDCFNGNANGDGCPTFEFVGAMDLNTYCILCGECLKTCPEDNIALNVRPWGADLLKRGRPRTDEAYLALLMLSITAFHGLTMTPVWQGLIETIGATLRLPAAVAFSVGMAAIMLGPMLIYAALIAVSHAVAADRSVPYRTYFVRYAYALLPIALFYHLAHNSEHLLMEGPKVLRLLSDPLGAGWNLFGTASMATPPLISLGTLWYVQVALVLIGHVYSLWVAEHTAAHLFPTRRAAFRSQLPILAGMILFSVFSLWLLKQPMLMRTSAM